jgi:NADPH-dependent glutamate synthase beta subunit-like oxidoreductase/coenzyme F420-reducing hydrogenase delta subunit/formate hydrogenlyase subunit 6/NADH:ubiquinone oxidoreductase subunit I
VNPGVLIIGGSPAGLQAAQDLADSGIEVLLAETSPFIGDDHAAKIPQYMTNTRALEVAKHPRIHLFTNTHLRGTERIGNALHVQLHQHPRLVDLNRCTGCKDCIEACPVTVPASGHKAIYLSDGIQPQCAVIDKAGIAPCSSACPAGIHVQGYVALIAEGRFQEALDLVREAIPFPGICGRICTHPCEVNCRRNEVDESVAIRPLKRFIADWERDKAKRAQVKSSKTSSAPGDAKWVAIVGAGPAGLTAAHYLALEGHCVTVFEKLPVAGGMMAVGIPAYRLPRDILHTEINAIKALGVEIETGITVGKDITLEALRSNGYLAVFLATGLHGSRKLGVVGEDFEGVLDGVSFLRDIALDKKVSIGQKVIVVGGGNVAIDVALTARRMGSEEVTIVCLETRDEMPAWEFEIKEALEAGVEIVNCFGPHRFLQKNGRFAGIEFKRCTCVFDDQCNFNPQYDEDDLNILTAETVIIAIGQMAERGLAEEEQIALSSQGGIQADPVTLQTSIPGVFAGGDAVYGPKTVIDAIAAGKQAAESIDRFLNGRDLKEGRISQWPDEEKLNDYKTGELLNGQISNGAQMSISQRPLTDEELVPKPRISMPALSLKESLSSFSEVELGYSERQAIAEAQRCMVCGPCSECMACVQACKAQAIIHEERETFLELDIDAIIFADNPAKFSQLPLNEDPSILRVSPQETLLGSVAAAHAMSNIFSERRIELPSIRIRDYPESPARIGVFVCQCGDQISQVLDTDGLRRQSAAMPGVTHAAVVSQACLPEAAELLSNSVVTHDLNRVVLAACACCSLDQVCFSCTFQRVRCKDNLGVFDCSKPDSLIPTRLISAENLSNVIWEFVNIREHCAWVHADYPETATAKAAALVASAVAKLRMWPSRLTQPLNADRSVLILGNSTAAAICQDLLKRQPIITRVAGRLPGRIWRVDGQYAAADTSNTQQATAIVLAPQDPAEVDLLSNAFAVTGGPKRLKTVPQKVETQLPGVFFCDPRDGASTGAAAAAKVAGWLGQLAERPKPIAALVDPHRCRACKTCIEICEMGAPQLVGQEPHRHSWIDPLICTQCGTCGAYCPSGAISVGYATDEQLEAMIEAVLKSDDLNAKEKAVVFTCNWSAYRGLEAAGRNHVLYSPSLYPLKVMCLGRLSPGIILKTFEYGAAGVLLLGCPPEECHYQFGGHRAKETFDLTRSLMRLLGQWDKRLVIDWVAADDEPSWATKVQNFVDGLNEGSKHAN